MDGDAVALLRRASRKKASVRLGAGVESVAESAGEIRLRLSDGDSLEASRLLVAVGRRPTVDGLGLEQLGVSIEKQGIVVDAQLQAAENVWAIGDVTGISLFTHVAKYQARIAAANVAGQRRAPTTARYPRRLHRSAGRPGRNARGTGPRQRVVGGEPRHRARRRTSARSGRGS